MLEPHTTVSESSLLRSPKASEGQGGALGEAEALRRGNTVGVRDQVLDLVAEQGMIVSRKERNEGLLPTPKARDWQAEGYEAGLRRTTPQLGTAIKGVVEGDERVLLPTPAVAHLRNHDEPIENYQQRRQDYLDGKTKGMPGASLGVAVRMEVLPTPLSRDWKESSAPHYRDGQVQTDNVPRAIFHSGEITEFSWGKFEPAIRQWEEILGRPAPAPTKPDGRDGSHRLSSSFTEWMMGLPENWVCDSDISRTDELKLCGNGVVPQQAAYALRYLLDGINLEDTND